MRVKRKDGGFKPITVEVVVESEEEALALKMCYMHSTYRSLQVEEMTKFQTDTIIDLIDSIHQAID